MKKLGLSIVIPTYNERDNISKILEEINNTLENFTFEIIFVDDNSPDGTSKEIKNFMKKSSHIRLIHRIGRRGLSGAVIEGIFAATSELVAVMLALKSPAALGVPVMTPVEVLRVSPREDRLLPAVLHEVGPGVAGI